uniref:Bcl-2 Bcl-2 homology region 1-3 domain-containing protein n=1 Tax=Leptobrachium leishanense TaxID=445787 RepID=A0A8C5PJK5_9ANUR
MCTCTLMERGSRWAGPDQRGWLKRRAAMRAKPGTLLHSLREGYGWIPGPVLPPDHFNKVYKRQPNAVLRLSHQCRERAAFTAAERDAARCLSLCGHSLARPATPPRLKLVGLQFPALSAQIIIKMEAGKVAVAMALREKEVQEDAAGYGDTCRAPESIMQASNAEKKEREDHGDTYQAQENSMQSSEAEREGEEGPETTRDTCQTQENPMQPSEAEREEGPESTCQAQKCFLETSEALEERQGEESPEDSTDTCQSLQNFLESSEAEQEEEDRDDKKMEADVPGPSPPPEDPQCRQDELFLYSRLLLLTFFREYAGGPDPGPVRALIQLAMPNTALQTLLRVARETIERNHACFQNTLNRLCIERPEHLQKLSLVTFALFSDGAINWGRIATLFSFTALVARHLKNLGMNDSIFTLADGVARFLTITKRSWFQEHQGWDGFVEFFLVSRWQTGIRIALLALAIFAGIATSLLYLIM